MVVDHKTVYCCFKHLSWEVLRHVREHTIDFPNIEIPTDNPVCSGCTLGKIPNRPFLSSWHRATCLFQLIHSDLKMFPTMSYYKQRYMIIFYDDFTSHAWISALTTKDKALQATKQFLAYIKNQYKAIVQIWILDGGGEYKSKAFDEVLKNRGIKILQSTPHTP